MKSSLILLIMLVAVATPRLGLGQENVVRSASIPHLRVEVSIERTSAGQPMLVEQFTTDSPYQHTVICVSGIYDMKYVLRGSSGAVISKSESAGDAPPFGGGGTPIGPTRAGTTPTPDPCKTTGANTQQRRVLLYELYPHLAHGTYTLQITLAPRGTHDQAVLSPAFRITI